MPIDGEEADAQKLEPHHGSDRQGERNEIMKQTSGTMGAKIMCIQRRKMKETMRPRPDKKRRKTG